MPSTSEGAAGPLTLLLGSIHCHSTLSDGASSPEEILERAAGVGLDFVAITDHVPPGATDIPSGKGSGPGRPGSQDRGCRHRPATAGCPPLVRCGVLRVPGIEYSPPRGHYIVLGSDAADLPSPEDIPGWPRTAACVEAVAGRADVLGFIAHPDDEGNRFLGLDGYRWDDWNVNAFMGLEVWNLGTDWSRHIHGHGDVVRALLAGLYRAVPPPSPVTLARWDRLAQERPVVGIAGTDAHAYRVRWKGLRLTVFPYGPSFGTLQTGVWVDTPLAMGPPESRLQGVLEALRRGRAFMVNRAWGHPLGFVFQARETGEGEAGAGDAAGAGDGPDGPGRPTRLRFISGDTVPPGLPVRFEVALPAPAWIRLLRNGRVVANTYGRELNFEPLPDQPPPSGDGARREAWRVEAWVPTTRWSRTDPGVCLWILSNFIYRLS